MAIWLRVFPKCLYGYAFVMVMIYGRASQQEGKVMRKEIAAMVGQWALGESCTICCWIKWTPEILSTYSDKDVSWRPVSSSVLLRIEVLPRTLCTGGFLLQVLLNHMLTQNVRSPSYQLRRAQPVHMWASASPYGKTDERADMQIVGLFHVTKTPPSTMWAKERLALAQLSIPCHIRTFSYDLGNAELSTATPLFY
jgi:hypothetical protein